MQLDPLDPPRGKGRSLLAVPAAPRIRPGEPRGWERH